MNLKKKLSSSVRPALYSMLVKTGKLAENMRLEAYLVGGPVRDVLLGAANLDMDITVEGDGIAFAEKLASRFGGGLVIHRKFHTAVWKGKVDIASTRTETYEYPGALPDVRRAGIEADLERRDFTINAMAMKLNPSVFGELMDCCGGMDDLKAGIIRVLHEKSFEDDPTRMFRAARFAARFSFALDKHTGSLLKKALKKGMIDRISGERLREEIIAVLDEEYREKGLAKLNELGLLKSIHPAIELDDIVLKRIGETRNLRSKTTGRWFICLLLLIQGLDVKQRKELCERLKFEARHERQVIGSEMTYEKIKSGLENGSGDSRIYLALNKVPSETLMYAMVRAGNGGIRNKIARYMRVLSRNKPFITGRKLIRMGYKPGPLFGRIFREVALRRMDGVLKTEEDEKKFIIDNFPKG